MPCAVGSNYKVMGSSNDVCLSSHYVVTDLASFITSTIL